MIVHMDQSSFSVTCPECNGVIDEQEDRCIHCGHDFRDYRDLEGVRRMIGQYRELWQSGRMEQLPPSTEQEEKS